MKIKWSPLVGSASGTTADAVAASWKGIQYIRKHVIPHNPQTDEQMLVRNSLARCVPLWRSLGSEEKAWLNKYGVDYRMSGFNVFMSKCRALEQALELILPMPPNPYEPAPDTFAAATGAGAGGDIDCTWVDNSSAPFQDIILLTRLSSGNLFDISLHPGADLEAFVISGLTPDTDYDVYAFFRNPNTGEFGSSTGVLDVTSKAA